MNVQLLLDRILDSVDKEAYLTPADQADPRYQLALDELLGMLGDERVSVERIRELAEAYRTSGRLDDYHLHSLLHVIAAHPRVQDYDEAARQIANQEMAAYGSGAAQLQHKLASVDRHRGVLAFVRGQYEVSLDYLTRALERQRSVENLGNVLCALIRLGELDEADGIVRQARSNFPEDFVRRLDQRIETDPDLIHLRS